MSQFESVNELIKDLIIPIVVVNCFSIGFLIKNSIPSIPNNKIPLIVSAVGILYNIWLNNFEITPKVFIEGLVSGMASTGAFELLKNLNFFT